MWRERTLYTYACDFDVCWGRGYAQIVHCNRHSDIRNNVACVAKWRSKFSRISSMNNFTKRMRTDSLLMDFFYFLFRFHWFNISFVIFFSFSVAELLNSFVRYANGATKFDDDSRNEWHISSQRNTNSLQSNSIGDNNNSHDSNHNGTIKSKWLLRFCRFSRWLRRCRTAA